MALPEFALNGRVDRILSIRPALSIADTFVDTPHRTRLLRDRKRFRCASLIVPKHRVIGGHPGMVQIPKTLRGNACKMP